MTRGKQSTRNIYLLGLVSFVNDTSSKIILPVLPLFISALGGNGLVLGLVGGIGETIASLFKIVSGILSDRFKRRKPFVFLGYFIASLSKLLLAFAGTWVGVLALRSAERLGKGLRQAPRDALLAASTTKENRGRGFGIHRALDSGGAVLGSLLALAMFWFLGFSFQHIFLTAGAIAFLSLVPVLFVRESSQTMHSKKLRISFSALSKKLRIFIVIATVFALANFSYMFFVMRSREFFSAELAVIVPIAMYAVYNLVATLFAVPAGILSDKVGRKKVLIAGYSLFALTCIGFVFLGSLEAFVFLFFLYGVFFALVDATERAFVSDLSSQETRGTALGTFQAFTGLAALPSGIIAGVLWDSVGGSATFAFGAGLSLLAVALFLFFSKRSVL